jgi:cytochrome d ubiquinol oxidase subunit I
VFDYHNFSGDQSAAGLKTIPQNLQPTVAPVFWGFRVMIYGAWGMFAVAFIGVIMRLRGRLYTERWFLRLVLWMLPVGVLATIGGWEVSDSGRQPWLVYGKLLVNNSASSLSTGELIASLAAFWVVYLTLVTAWIRQILREVRRGPDPLPGREGDEPALPGASDAPAPPGRPITPVEA